MRIEEWYIKWALEKERVRRKKRYIRKEKNNAKKEEAVKGIIKHEMETTYLFLKYPNTKRYKFVGVFEKDIAKMEKSISEKNPMVVYKKKADKIELKSFF